MPRYEVHRNTGQICYCQIKTWLWQCMVGRPQRLISKLQTVQNRAARVIFTEKKSHHLTPALIKLHWLPVRQRIQYNVLVLTWKALHSQAPIHTWQSYCSHTSLSGSSDQEQLTVSRSHRQIRQCMEIKHVSAFAPQLWNNLPDSLRNCDKLST